MAVFEPEHPQPDEDFEPLRQHLAGQLHEPGDPRYAALAMPWNVAVATRPAVVVAAATARDVAETVKFAAAAGMPVAVQATGHGIASDLDGALLVHTGALDECTLHPDGWARAGAGVRWSTVLADAAGERRGALCGSAPGVGVVGYTTGGGIGPLVRSHGAASDRVRSFDVVTGDGQIRHATARSEPDLFWGLRGGKGSLGIVTAVEFDLLDQPEIYAGALYFDADSVADVALLWSQWCPTLPAEATTSLALMQLPEIPGIPAPLAGRFTAAVRFVYTGGADDGARVLAPMRAAGRLLIDAVGTMPYAQIGMVHADPEESIPASEYGSMLADFSAPAVDALLAGAGPASASRQTVVEVRQLGGALAREPEVPSAFSHRGVGYALYSVGIAPPPDLPDVAGNARGIHGAMSAWSPGTMLPNFAVGAGAAGFAASYSPASLSRLAQLASHYDPDHVFRLGQVPVRV
ncbi:FAD-binding oxidoreductase [Arthrobacter sp. 35W]|uniref:FAD-binding oxidoreductase n=1 Tax=Arthrobacter sp. 35W TaxID=1132441 RepID=UPI00041E5E76|nr:FAD-binding protein [Arthrobacter sp. 35W]